MIEKKVLGDGLDDINVKKIIVAEARIQELVQVFRQSLQRVCHISQHKQLGYSPRHRNKLFQEA